MINYFATLKEILDSNFEYYLKSHNIQKDFAIGQLRDFLKDNSRQYYSDSPNLDYSAPLCRLGYLFCYVAAHANLLDNAVEKIPEIKLWLLQFSEANKPLRICDFGGGPGSELLGFIKFYERNCRDKSFFIDLEFTIVDKCNEWIESWDELVLAINKYVGTNYCSDRRQWPFLVHKSFLNLSYTEEKNYSNFSSLFNKDFFILNYVVSEIANSEHEGFLKVLTKAISGAPSGAVFLIIDRKQSDNKISDMTFQLFNDARLAIPVHQFYKETSSIDSDEQIDSLGEWVNVLAFKPKLKWDAFYAYVHKP